MLCHTCMASRNWQVEGTHDVCAYDAIETVPPPRILGVREFGLCATHASEASARYMVQFAVVEMRLRWPRSSQSSRRSSVIGVAVHSLSPPTGESHSRST